MTIEQNALWHILSSTTHIIQKFDFTFVLSAAPVHTDASDDDAWPVHGEADTIWITIPSVPVGTLAGPGETVWGG